MNDPLKVQDRVRRQVLRRRRWRRARIAILSVTATVAVLAAAFGVDRLAVAVHNFYVEHHHPAIHVTGSKKGVTPTTATTVPGPARCDSPQLSATVSDWNESNGTVEEKVSLTNISAAPCSLTGYPTLGAAAQTGTPLPAPTNHLASIGGPEPVGSTIASGPVILVHGARASFVLSFANVCDRVLLPGVPATGTPNECYAGSWLEVTPPQATSPLLVSPPLRLTYATAGFQVGPFQVGDGPPLPGQPSPTIPRTVPTNPPATTTPSTTVPATTPTTAAQPPATPPATP
ncbi:MAG TPA: DUF4232 domain-containing protein [Acidimicrobiales bacterium]|nr:DUF4232 domain-containing protein [Acidimicrobiales bacterium]